MNPKIQAISAQAATTAQNARVATHGSLTPAMAVANLDPVEAGRRIFGSVVEQFSAIRANGAGLSAEAVRNRLTNVWTDAVASVGAPAAAPAQKPGRFRPS